MSLVMSTRNGRPCVELADHKGEVYGYHFSVLVDTDKAFHVRLDKIDTDKPQTYYVTLGKGWHQCDCPSHTYNKNRRVELCKHARAAASLRDVLKAMAAPQTASKVS